jgi:Macrocin-O-methyltransferase (TylF)
VSLYRAILWAERLCAKAGLTVHRATGYHQDGLCSVHNHSFMHDPAFRAAYARGVQAAGDYRWHWRVHVGLWAASSATHLPGDFVECGVSHGFLSSAIMEYLDWNRLNRTFYLLDTFSGLDPRYIAAEEHARGVLARNEGGFYATVVDRVRQNFAQWPRTKIIVGAVPETLSQVDATRIAYLHLDMNCAPPEVAAFHCFWDRLVPGAMILLDDYANRGFETQKTAMDEAASRYHLRVLSLPTGQGLIVKPSSGELPRTPRELLRQTSARA